MKDAFGRMDIDHRGLRSSHQARGARGASQGGNYVYGYGWEVNDRLGAVEERGAGSIGPEDDVSSSSA